MFLPPRVKLALLAVMILLFLLAALLVVLPTLLVSRPETKAAIQDYLSAALGGEVRFERATLTLFPRVCATVEHPRLNRPDKLSARSAEIDVCLRLLPLFRGVVEADAIQAQALEVLLPIVPLDASGSGRGLPDLRRLMAQATGWAKQLPETTIVVRSGRVELAGPVGQHFELRNLNIRFRRDGERLQWSLQGESDELKTFSSQGRLEAESLQGTSTLQVSEFRPRALMAYFMPGAHFQVLDGHADLELSVALEGPGRARATIAGKAPMLVFGYGDRRTHVSVDRFEGRVELLDRRLAVSISEFSARTPRAALELAFVIDEEAHPKIALDLKGRGDLAGARDFALAMLHRVPAALLVCDILRSGDVPHIQVKLHGDSWSDLDRLDHLSLEGRLEKGRIYIPWIDLDVDQVSGYAQIAGGILQGRDLKAHYQGTRGENGTLRVGLSAALPVLQLDIFARADLSALPPLLARMVSNPVFRRELALIEQFSGRAQGTLRLEGTHKDVQVEVQATELDVTAHYRPIPYPLRFQSGELVYRGEEITLRGVDVAIGRSKLLKHDLTLGLAGDHPLESSSPQALIDLGEMFSLFHDRPPFSHLRRLEGVLTFHDWRISGQAFAPETWRLSSNGTVQDLSVESEHVPVTLSLASGRFDWQDRTLRCQGAQVSLNRSTLKGLTLEADWEGSPRVQLRALALDASLNDISQLIPTFPAAAPYAAVLSALEGAVRMQAVSCQARLLPEGLTLDRFEAVLVDSVIESAPIGLPLALASGEISLQPPAFGVRIAKASLGKSETQNLSASGNWGIDGSLELHADSTVIECGEIFPRLLSLTGLASLREDVRSMHGTLSTPRLSLRGPIRAPRHWNIQALSEFKDIVLNTAFLEEPIELGGRLRFAKTDAQGFGETVLHLDSTRVRIGTDAAVLAGDIGSFATGTVLHLDIRAEAVAWKNIERISDRIARYSDPQSPPVKGRVNMRIERLSIDRFQLHPFYAQATLAEEARIEIERASLCGMPFIGRLAFHGPMIEAYLVPVVDVVPLERVVSCLTREASIYTGSFNLNGALKVSARREDIVKAMNGDLQLMAEDGTIRQSVFFARLIALLNLTEIYRGSLPDFSSQGLDYKRLSASLEVKEGKIRVNDSSIDGRTLWIGSRGEIDIATQEIDFTIMVSPFKTIDRIINSIPGLRWALGGRLVAIPMKAVGSLEDPRLIPLAPSAVGTSILEMIERTLLLPVEIIQPLVPGIESTPGSTISR